MTSPSNSNGPSAALKEAIDSSFGSVDELKTKFNAAAATRFGEPASYTLNNLQLFQAQDPLPFFKRTR